MEERNHWAQIVEETSEGNFLLLKFLFRVMEESNHWAQIVGETSEGNFFTLTDSFQSAWLVNFQGRSLQREFGKSNQLLALSISGLMSAPFISLTSTRNVKCDTESEY